MEENMNDMHGEETPRTDLTLFSEKMQELKSRIASVIVGQERTVDLVLTAILANGHVLIEGVPGVAKTLLARLTARLIDADFSRVQFTPDLMPSDVLGTTVFNMKTNEFDFHRGPVFANIILVDEINRAPAKTQSALFEVMEERQASIDGTTYRMGELYTILAQTFLYTRPCRHPLVRWRIPVRFSVYHRTVRAACAAACSGFRWISVVSHQGYPGFPSVCRTFF